MGVGCRAVGGDRNGGIVKNTPRPYDGYLIKKKKLENEKNFRRFTVASSGVGSGEIY